MTNYPLIAGSFLVLTIVFERVWRFRGLAVGTRELARKTIDALVQRDVDSARDLCEASEQPIAGIFLEAMRWRNVPLEDLERVLSTSRQEAAHELRRGLWIVGTIGSLAPYVGLFGTVIGIIHAFDGIASTGSGGLAAVSGGISEALVATALGILVAIPAVMAFNYFTGMLERFQVEMNTSSAQLVDFLSKRMQTANASH